MIMTGNIQGPRDRCRMLYRLQRRDEARQAEKMLAVAGPRNESVEAGSVFRLGRFRQGAVQVYGA